MAKGKNKPKNQHPADEEMRRVTVDIGDDEDFDEDLEADEVVTEDGEIDPYIAKMMARSQKMIDDRMSKIDARLDAHEVRLKELEAKVGIMPAVATAPAANQAAASTPASASKNTLDSVLDLTFGTVGKVLHGIVDTASFVTSSAVDLVTLGRARPQTK